MGLLSIRPHGGHHGDCDHPLARLAGIEDRLGPVGRPGRRRSGRGNYHFVSDIIGGLYLGVAVGVGVAGLMLSPGDRLASARRSN